MLSPSESATIEASKGGLPSSSTKIVVDAGAPSHCFSTRTVAGMMLFLIVQMSTAPAVAGAVTANGPPVYGTGAASPHWIVAV